MELGFVDFGFLLVVGLAIGTLGTLIGLGGGFIVIPVLILIYNFNPQLADGTSLMVVFLNALSGTVAYARQGKINYKIGLAFAIATLPGVFLGYKIVHLLNKGAFQLSFGLLNLVVAIYLFFGRKEVVQSSEINARMLWFGLVFSFLAGIVSTTFGVGGGIIHVPVMILALGMATHQATATSHFILAISSLIGFSQFAYAGEINISYALILGLSALVGAQIGGWLSTKVKGLFIKRLFAVVALLISLKFIYDGATYHFNFLKSS